MTALKKPNFISIEDYLEGEERSEIKHEYLEGLVHAMSGGTFNHARISGNICGKLLAKLEGKPCQPWNSDTMLKVERSRQTRFYYPDCQVICQPVPGTGRFSDSPTVLAEVLSESTRRIDTGEKKEAYLTIPSLKVLMLVDSEQKQVTVYRRSPSGEFEVEGYADSGTIALAEIGAEISLEEIYRGVELA